MACIARTSSKLATRTSSPALPGRSMHVKATASSRVRSVQVAAKMPAGISAPAKLPAVPPAKHGFVYNAERLNSRACMLGFFALIAVEYISGRSFLQMIGLTIGNGLGFEF